MKKYTLPIILATAILLAACGSPAPAATQPPATQVPVQSSTTTDPAVQPASTESAPAASAATEVDIKLADNTIESSLTTFKTGVPYTFVIKNTGEHDHNFNINIPVAVTGSLDASLSSALLTVGKDKLSAGASVTVQYTFPDSAAGQQLEFSCLIRRHYDDGMKLAIMVTK